MAILRCVELSRCCCCNLRLGVQIIAVIDIVFSAAGIYSGINSYLVYTSDEFVESTKFMTFFLDCTQSNNCLEGSAAGNIDECLEINVEKGGDDGCKVKMMKPPKSWIGETKYNYNTWKLIKIEDNNDKNVFPEGKKDDEELQKTLKKFPETCKDKKADNPMYKMTFDWREDPANHWVQTRDKASALSRVISSFVWFVLWSCVAFCVFGSQEGIVGKAKLFKNLTRGLLAWMCVDAALGVAYIILTWGELFHEFLIPAFLIGKVVNLVVFIHIDNLNDIVQVGGTGAEGFSAKQLPDDMKITNEDTPLLFEHEKPEETSFMDQLFDDGGDAEEGHANIDGTWVKF